MSLCKSDVLSDLVFALNFLEGPDFETPLTDAVDLDAVSNDKLLIKLRVIGEHSFSYPQAKERAEVSIAHAAIEKGLKALLLEGGRSERCVRKHGHHLHLLLLDAQQHTPMVYKELERCFNSVIRYLEQVTSISHNICIVDYFREHGTGKVYEVSRYESLEGRGSGDPWGMIGQVYREIIRALISLLLGCTPRDIDFRIEERARAAILAASHRDPTWDADQWVRQGPVRPRIEDIQNLRNKVLYAAVRGCEKDSRSSGVRYWARHIRRTYISVERAARIKRWRALEDKRWNDLMENARLATREEENS